MRGVRRAVIDTNVIIYDLLEDSLYHREASGILDSLEEWVIPSIVVHELVWFMRGLGLDALKARELVLQYVENEKSNVKPILPRHVRRALAMIAAEGLALSRYNDKLILALAAEEEAPLASFDEKLRRQARRLGLGVMPEEVPTAT